MAYRLHSKLLLRPSLFARLCAVPVMMLVAGCQSNVQHDLIAREMRMQEDQIYAMEDYLGQYQQLICKYRAENAALRRQLAEVEDTDATLPTRPSPPARNGTPPAIKGPEIEVPATPPANGTRPQPQIDVPEVPPLEETTSSDTELEEALRQRNDLAQRLPDLIVEHARRTLATSGTPERGRVLELVRTIRGMTRDPRQLKALLEVEQALGGS